MNDHLAQEPRQGGCLCQAVRYEVEGPLRDVIACHCSQCRKSTGHYMAATAASRQRLKLTQEHGLAWYQSSPDARRGYCKCCGSTLFWEGPDRGYTAIAAGSLDDAEGLRMVAHIFVSDKADYYEIKDGLPQYPQGGHAVPPPCETR